MLPLPPPAAARPAGTSTAVAAAQAEQESVEATVVKLRGYVAEMALLLLAYNVMRLAWHVYVPSLFNGGWRAGDPAVDVTLPPGNMQPAGATASTQLSCLFRRAAELPFVPLVAEVAALEAAAFLLFWAGGGLSGGRRERPWMLNVYNLLAMAVFGKVGGCLVWLRTAVKLSGAGGAPHVLRAWALAAATPLLLTLAQTCSKLKDLVLNPASPHPPRPCCSASSTPTSTTSSRACGRTTGARQCLVEGVQACFGSAATVMMWGHAGMSSQPETAPCQLCHLLRLL